MSDALWEQAQRLHASRLFGTRSPEHAYALALIGAEIGVGPTTALTQIAIIQGKPAFGAALVGALIQKSNRYSYIVRELTDDHATVVFYERASPSGTGGLELGTSTFTMQDALKARLGNSPTWQQYPRNLLLARALTNGARWYCPDILAGAAYTPDELGSGGAVPLTDADAGPLPGEGISLEDLVALHGLDAILEVTGGEVPATDADVQSAAVVLAERAAASPPNGEEKGEPE